eukprot:TRINITY_DN46080_c0_g1_i2.p1 TRINITY_DN46080_c0_g1~~TRINITY_DN46080_c0_g1_i2.p1  ORF type:complete len:143 (+),score=18.25 TRINITY_DN46080_c0_g1_i2:178-606(+)
MASHAVARPGCAGSILLSWDPEGERPPTGYRILIQTDGVGPYLERDQERVCRNNDMTSCVLEGLSVGSSYKFKVAALYGADVAVGSPASNAVTPCVQSPSPRVSKDFALGGSPRITPGSSPRITPPPQRSSREAAAAPEQDS